MPVLTSEGETTRCCVARVVESGLEERARLERTLHDGPQQRLLAVATALGLASVGAPPALREVLDRARQELAVAMHEIREFARELHPALLASEGLESAVEAMIERLPLAAHIDISPERLPPVVEATAYDLIRKVLADAVARGDTSKVAVTAHVEYGRLQFSIIDDGPDDRDLASDRTGLNDRVKALGGQVLSGVGTLIHGWIPARMATDPNTTENAAEPSARRSG